MTEKVDVIEFRRRSTIWSKELPSYEQATGSLHRPDDGFCCLGVGSQLCGLGFWAELGEEDGEGNDIMSWVAEAYREEVENYERGTEEPLTTPVEASLMPSEVVEYYGLTDNIGSFDFHSLPASLRWNILQHLTSPDVIGKVEDEQKEALLDQGKPYGSIYGRPGNLAFLNDRGVAFWIIAEIIRLEPKGLFTWSP